MQLKKVRDPLRAFTIRICEFSRLSFQFKRFEVFPDVVARAFIFGTMRNHDRARLLYAVRFVFDFKVLRFRYAI